MRGLPKFFDKASLARGHRAYSRKAQQKTVRKQLPSARQEVGVSTTPAPRTKLFEDVSFDICTLVVVEQSNRPRKVAVVCGIIMPSNIVQTLFETQNDDINGDYSIRYT